MQVVLQLPARVLMGSEGEVQRLGERGEEDRHERRCGGDTSQGDPCHSIGKVVAQLRSRRQRQVCLAAAAGADQAQQAAGRVFELLPDRDQLCATADQRSQRDGQQPVRGSAGGGCVAISRQPPVERQGFGGRFDPQFGGEDAAAGFELGQRRRAIAAGGQRLHGLDDVPLPATGR